MRQTRGLVIVATVAAAAAIAACSSSSPTGPSAAALAHLFDSAATVDASNNRSIIERLLALAADEGGRPTGVKVTTDAGTKSLQVIALELVDTSTTGSGLVTDSAALFLGYSTDYSTYLATEQANVTGNADVLPPTRVRAGHAVLQQLRSVLHANRAGGPIAAAPPPSVQFAALVVQGDSGVNADSIALTSTVAPVSGACAWQHVDLTAILGSSGIDSTIACTRVAVTQTFTLHFPAHGGIDASLQHVSMSSTAFKGPRVLPTR
jgi:hypothetical protein